MIVSFGASNFGSFKEEFEVSFESKGEISQVLCIEGANGSGKTTLLKVLGFLKEFINSSFTKNKADDKLVIPTHFFSEKETKMFINFQLPVDGNRYRYEVILVDGGVKKERLSRQKPKGKTFSVFEREDDKIIKTLKEFNSLKEMKLRDNASVISTSIQYEFGMSEIGKYFDDMQCNVNISGYKESHYDLSVDYLSKFLYDNNDLKNYIRDFLKGCDLGITDLTISKMDFDNTTKYYPVFEHGLNKLSYLHESSGTQTLYKTLLSYFMSAYGNTTLIYDEFDKHLHSLILPKLLELFKGSKGQFIFTTFNIDIMDRLGKYNVYIVEKTDNESYAYRLDEIKGLRNDRPVSNYYKKGLLGGVPR